MKKILIIAPSWVGDCVLMQPMLHRLKQRHPSVQLDVLAPPWTEKLLRQLPEVNEVINNPFAHGAFRFSERRDLGRRLQAAKYDQAIVLPNSWKSALIPYFADIPVRTGFIGEMRFGLLNDARKLVKTKLPLMVERFSQLAEDKHQDIMRPIPYPHLQVNEEQRAQVLGRFKLSTDRPVAVFCPGAEFGPAKRWPVQYYAELGQRLNGQGYAIWLIGSPKDKEVADKIVALGNSEAINLCGTTDLSDAIALISCASLVVSNDSGLMHIAAALDRPMLAIFGSSSPQFTPPLSSHADVLRLDLPCSPCFKRECPLGHFNCMMQLTPQEVARHIPIRSAQALRQD
ncbi:MAG: lipopolysaccharide heptosyltransferase II [Sideroxydans sp.]